MLKTPKMYEMDIYESVNKHNGFWKLIFADSQGDI